jgi:outer membrane protein assembly factor BamA
LFKTGERLDIEEAIESARNIRLRKFIGEVFITGAANGDDGVDITVTTYDNWTTKLALFLEQGGGSYSYGASLAEDNLLGYGRMIQLSGSLSDEDDGFTVFFHDDRIGRTRWAGRFLYSNFTLNSTILISTNKPQYSLDIPFGAGGSFTRSDGVRRLYSGGEEFFRYNRILNRLKTETVYSWGREKRLNLYGLYNYEQFDYSPYYSNSIYNDILIPPDEKRSYPSLGIGGSVIKFDLQRYLDEAGTPEDLTLGGSLKFIIGRSVPEFGADFVGTKTIISSGFLVKPLDRLFIRGGDFIEWWHLDGRNEKINHFSELMLYYKSAETHVLALRAYSNFAWREKPGYQVLLGGGNGLRGYSSRELEGDKLALGNMEYRYYTPWEIFTVRIGGVMFFDIGDVWQKGERIRFDDLKSDIGVGLRLGMTKSSTSRVFRFDVGKALTEDNYYISFGTGLIFNLGSRLGND